MNMTLFGDCRDIMRDLSALDVRVQCCVTSPPYFGLRDYGHPGQIGLEKTPAEYVATMVDVFACVWDLLADDGVLWLNLGDSYASGTKGSGGAGKSTLGPNKDLQNIQFQKMAPRKFDAGLPDKQLMGLPWRVAFALQEAGWYLRQDIIWHKPNPMPESVRDRCTKAHEYVFLLTKSARYYWDADAMKEPSSSTEYDKTQRAKTRLLSTPYIADGNARDTRNRRSVWTVAPKPYKGAHFATFPPGLIEPMILAGSRPGDIVLDPFMGSGTVAQVAQALGREWIGCELNPEYGPLQRERIARAEAK